MAFSPDGRQILTGGGDDQMMMLWQAESVDQTARLWHVRTGRLLRQYVGHESPLLTVAFAPDGQHIYTADTGNVYAWRTTLADVIDFACERLSRDYTAAERAFYNIEGDGPTCPELTEQVAQVEPPWTPTTPGAGKATPLTLEVQRGLGSDPACVPYPDSSTRSWSTTLATRAISRPLPAAGHTC